MAHLTRAAHGRPVAPVRILHLGLGNFFRAHLAWYTDRAADADEWGIAAFTGRSPGVVADLNRQEGLYTLLVQHATGNEYEIVSSISAAHPASDGAAWLDYAARPEVSLVTSTVTEAAYQRTSGGGLDADSEFVQTDVAAVREGRLTDVTTVPGRFVAALVARRAAGAGPLSFCPCDNVPDNGQLVERIVRDFAKLADSSLLSWIDDNVGFVTTMVDRITPRPTDATRAAVCTDTGIDDPVAVATEPFSQWVLAGEFKAGRPAWESAGAQFVEDVGPYEKLKLWLLNGSHSLMAYAAPLKRLATVHEAITDREVRGWVNDWWDVAARRLDLPDETVTAYRAALLERYENPQLRHLLAQIAADGSQKLPIRIVPALKADRADNGRPLGAERAVAAWALHLRGLGAPLNDVRAAEVIPLAEGTLEESVEKVCGYLGIDDKDSRASVFALARPLEGMAR